jgi:hypothetical protein
LTRTPETAGNLEARWRLARRALSCDLGGGGLGGTSERDYNETHTRAAHSSWRAQTMKRLVSSSCSSINSNHDNCAPRPLRPIVSGRRAPVSHRIGPSRELSGRIRRAGRPGNRAAVVGVSQRQSHFAGRRGPISSLAGPRRASLISPRAGPTGRRTGAARTVDLPAGPARNQSR